MKEQMHEILMNLNRGRIAVSEAQEHLLDLFSVRLSLPPDFGVVDEGLTIIDIEDLKKCGWEYAKKWLEEVREEKNQWANAYHNLKRVLESNEA